jgi:sterol desaturase/sphingolipid hydroxylase (fatty acid hydroxylase superfamily)
VENRRDLKNVLSDNATQAYHFKMTLITKSRQTLLVRYVDHADFVTVPLALLTVAYSQTPCLGELAAYLTTFAAGAVLWTFIEYWVHRALHMRDFPLLPAVHARLRAAHIKHHQNPSELPGGTLYSSAILLAVVIVGFAVPAVSSLFLGVLFGYLVFIVLHYAEHHGVRLGGPIVGRLAANHLVHHRGGQLRKFGVSSNLWDLVFGTA